MSKDVIDGLRVIIRRRGCKIQQGDVLAVERAVSALLKTKAENAALRKVLRWAEGWEPALAAHIKDKLNTSRRGQP